MSESKKTFGYSCAKISNKLYNYYIILCILLIFLFFLSPYIMKFMMFYSYILAFFLIFSDKKYIDFSYTDDVGVCIPFVFWAITLGIAGFTLIIIEPDDPVILKYSSIPLIYISHFICKYSD